MYIHTMNTIYVCMNGREEMNEEIQINMYVSVCLYVYVCMPSIDSTSW